MSRGTDSRRPPALLLCGLLAAAVGGCQRKAGWSLVPVEGAVTAADGRPVRGVEVVFLPDAAGVGPRATATTDEAGRFRLRTDGGDDGAAVGPYRVCLHDNYRAAAPQAIGRLAKTAGDTPEGRRKIKELGELAAGPPRVPNGYGRPNETPLRVVVDRPAGAGAQTVDLRLP